jgi:pimeloyl-ACP methyl ester carboxylesterase
MSDGEPIRLVLYSGLAANAKVFVHQKYAFPQLEVPNWPVPNNLDTLDSYCQRLAESLPTDRPIIIGGASFGGIIALHVAEFLKPKAVLLIGSICSPKELPKYARWARPFRKLVRLFPVRAVQWLLAPLASNMAHRFLPLICELVRQLRDSNPQVFRWSVERILDWQREPRVSCPIFHIHGRNDRVLPLRYTTADRIVEGGGHLISLTHPDEINEFIRQSVKGEG